MRVRWMLEAAKGIAYMHSEGVVHRDIALRNLLLDDAGRGEDARAFRSAYPALLL